MSLALLVGLAGAGVGLAQQAAGLVTEHVTEDCRPHPIPGTVPYNLGQQSIETNAQAYSAEALVRDTIARGGVFGLRLNNLYGVTSVPTIATCGSGQQFGTLDLDLFSSATAIGVHVPLGGYKVKLFYAGSVTGSHYHFPRGIENERYYTSWGYAGLGYAAAFLAPLAPLISRDDGLQTMAGDFIAGASLGIPDNPDLGTLDVGYVYSSGVYSNVSSQRLKLFATTMLTDRFALLALLRLGVDDVPTAGESRRDKVGATSLYGQNRVLRAPATLQTADAAGTGFRGLLADKDDGVDLSTVHIEQRRIGQFLTVSAALAVRPTVFLHEGSVGVELPLSALADIDRDSPLAEAAAIRGVLGVSEMPALPWYANEGGRQVYFDLSFGDLIHVRRNAPSTLAIFPYAQGAWEFSLTLEAGALAPEEGT